MLAFGLLARLAALDSLEPNVQPDEADHLQVIYRILAGHGPGVFGLSWDGNPAASLYPGLVFVKLLGPSYVSLRLSTVLASLLTLAVFFLLARQTLSLFASLAATTLLAFSSWFLFFSRSGVVNIWVLLYLLSAAYCVQRGLSSTLWRYWIAAGIFCGLGWYSYISGILILPMLLLYLLVAVVQTPDRRRWILSRSLALTLIAIAVMVPRVPILINQWEAVNIYVGSRSILRDASPFDAPGVLANQLWISVRALVLMDSTLQGNSRNTPPGAALLDSVSGTLYFIGLVLGVRQFRQTALWWCVLAPIVLVVHPLTQRIPDGARALQALPAMMLFAGLAIDWLIRLRLAGPFAQLALVVAVPATAYSNWSSFVQWQRDPRFANARQPAVELHEYAAWQELQLAETAAGRRGFNVMEWQARRGRSSQPPPVPTAAGPSVATDVRLEARALADYGAVAGLKHPRGVALESGGAVFVAEEDGQLAKFDRTGAKLASFGTGSGSYVEQASDLALTPDGMLLVLDAGRSQIGRYDSNGRFLGTLGAAWGMYRPRGLTIGHGGTVYIADTGRNRVLITRGQRVEQELLDFDQPTDVAVDARGWIYVVQPESGRLTVLDQLGRRQADWKVSRGNTVDGPHLAFVDAGALAITDPERRRVVLLDLAGREAGSIGGPNQPVFGLPYALAAAGDRLLVADSSKRSLLSFQLVPVGAN